jgi:hypothetical protein
MARKITDIVQVKLRIPEWLRRQVLAEAKKSGRSLNGELARLIEKGLVKPEYESLIMKAADIASIKATSEMVRAFTQALEQALKGTPEGVAMLKFAAASVPTLGNATSPSGHMVRATMPSEREPYQPFSYSRGSFSQDPPRHKDARQPISAEDEDEAWSPVAARLLRDAKSDEQREEIRREIEELKNSIRERARA